MTCKDCYHYNMCLPRVAVGGDKICESFKDKSRIVELPCKVGDDLYYPWVYDGTSGIAILEVAYVKFYGQGMSVLGIKNPESDMPMPTYFYDEDFGKEVFLTREEAEEALRKDRENRVCE